MKGKLTIIKTDGSVHIEPLDKPSNLEKLQTAVGGSIQIVPMFETFNWSLDPTDVKKAVECVAFCNEEGKLHGLPFNRLATLLWSNFFDFPLRDILLGDVAIITGDEEFMKEL